MASNGVAVGGSRILRDKGMREARNIRSENVT
jgi:hypothetical protein